MSRAYVRAWEQEVMLQCKHTITFLYALPKVGEKCWCVRCEDYKKVIQRRGSWNWACKKCKSHGMGHPVRSRISLQAERHADQTRHDVIFFKENFSEREEVVTISHHRNTEPMF